MVWQGGMLMAHWLIKGIFERFVPSVDPSGHMRVATNTAVYIAWASTADCVLLPIGMPAAAVCTAWMGAQAFSVLQSATLHHSLADMFLGTVLAAPQLALLALLERPLHTQAD